MTQILSFNHKTLPMCETCVIKEVCNQTCLGSNLETPGDMFAPNPSVCRLQYARVIGAIRTLKSIGLYDDIINSINRNIQMSYWLLENKIMGGETNGNKENSMEEVLRNIQQFTKDGNVDINFNSRIEMRFFPQLI